MDLIDEVFIQELFRYLIALVGLLLGIIYFKLYLAYRGNICAIPKIIISFLGFYWCLYYLRHLFGINVQAHQIWVRSPLLITLSAMLFIGFLSLWRLEK